MNKCLVGLMILGMWLLPVIIVRAQDDDTDLKFRRPENDRYQLYANRTGRLLTVKESGQGSKRPAKYWIYEFLKRGESLRLLHSVELLHANGPLASAVTDDGRFLLTFDDRDTRVGSSDKDLVIYDLVRNEHTKYSIKDFYSQETISKLDKHIFGGVVWCEPCPYCKDNFIRQEVYITHYCAKSGLQLDVLAVDLPSRSIRKVSPALKADIGIEYFSGPFYFDHIKIKQFGPSRRVQSLPWDWANENGSTKFRVVDQPAFPKYLKLEFTKKDDTQDFWVFARGDEDIEHYHRIDPKEVAEYVWCSKRPRENPFFKNSLK